MKQEFDVQEQFICDECGYVSPVANERCPDCGSTMTSLSDDASKKRRKDDGEDDEFSDDIDAPTSSLEDLQTKEQEESDEEYRNDTYGEDE